MISAPSKIFVAAWILGFVMVFSSTPRAQLLDYIKRPDPAFHWEHIRTQTVEQGKVYSLHMVSQVWQGIRWQHQLQIYEPKSVAYPDIVLLYITGGHADRASASVGFAIAQRARMRVAILYQIPNQPLFGGLREDALIAYTFTQYLRTGDGSWPLLFPMVKSAIKAMDALQDFAPRGWGAAVKRFIIAGVSKRGWTTWLTAATGDPRVAAIAPMAIDMLDIPAQMRHQVAVYGHYSSEIDDYVNAGLLKPKVVNSPRGRRLWGMVDPYTYRQKLTLPKLIVRGTNDPYWTQDALNIYWGGLRDGKWILYVPNAGHDMHRNRERLYNTAAAFACHVASGAPMPELRWSWSRRGGQVRLAIRSGSQPPQSARLWVASSATEDFRKSRWTSRPMHPQNGRYVGDYATPQSGYEALFGEMYYTDQGQPYTLSTQIRIVPGAAR